MSFASGILQVLGGALAIIIFGLAGFGGWHGNIDQSTVWVIQGLVINKLHLVGYIIVIASMLAIPWIQFKRSSSPESYNENLE